MSAENALGLVPLAALICAVWSAALWMMGYATGYHAGELAGRLAERDAIRQRDWERSEDARRQFLADIGQPAKPSQVLANEERPY